MTSPGQRIATNTQATMLLSDRYADVIAALALGNAAASEVARTLGKPLSSVHTLLGSLLAGGVIRVSAMHSRAGRPIREYELPLPWHIPFGATTAATLRELLAEQLKVNLNLQVGALAEKLETLYETPNWFIEVSAPSGVIQRRLENLDLGVIPHQSIIASSLELQLSPERAALLKERLNELVTEFQHDDSCTSSGPWGLMVLLTPPGQKD